MEEWKKSLVSLQNKAGQDKQKLKVVNEYVAKTKMVIDAFNAFYNAGDFKTEASKVALSKLQDAFSCFEYSVLTLSEDDEALLYKAIQFGAGIGGAIGFSISLAIWLSMPAFGIVLLSLAIPILMATVGIMLSTVVARQSVEATAVDPVGYGDCISDKLIAFGIFGNGPKHKARHFFDAVKKQTDEPQVDKVSSTEEAKDMNTISNPRVFIKLCQPKIIVGPNLDAPQNRFVIER